ncbi:MAG: MarR family transcriptional regulator [Lachnospiraceae bacterium]|nr:MarR family transcriptional regulator [Lachnospiraceae bacterium]
MDKFTKELDAAMGKIIEYDRLAEKKPQDYGCGVLLHMGDIHMIEVIGNYPDHNVTELADLRGVTKGTVSKMVRKLEKEGFIQRYQCKGNKKENYFKLTELGKKAYEGHYAFHERKSKWTHDQYSKYTESEKKLLLNFLKMYAEYMKDYI